MIVNSITSQQETTNLQELADSELTQATLNTTNIRMFPKPFNDALVIDSEIDDQLEIRSIDGTEVMNIAITSGISKVATSEFSQGIYLLVFKTQSRIFKMLRL